MHTLMRPGSRIRIQVNSDWSGDAVVLVGDQELRIAARHLLAGTVSYIGDLDRTFLCEAVSIAVEAYMRGEAVGRALGLTLPRPTEKP